MEKAYIIESENKYSFFKAFRMRLQVEENCGFYIIRIPKVKRKKEYIRLCNKIKKLGIKKVCYEIIKDEVLEYYMKQEFEVASGEYALFEFFEEIISFFAKKKNILLSDSHLVLITNRPKEAERYISCIYKKVKRISVYTTQPSLFFYLYEKCRDEYGIFLELKGKNDKVKKYLHIYVNLDKTGNFDENFFKSCYLLDIYACYKGGYSKVIFRLSTDKGNKKTEKRIKKNITFIEFLTEKNANISRKGYKIVNIEKL